MVRFTRHGSGMCLPPSRSGATNFEIEMKISPYVAACALRDRLIPIMPTKKIRGRIHKILPVVFIRHEPGPTLVYAIPPNAGSITIESPFKGCPVVKKSWEGPTDKKTESMAKKLFMERKNDA